MYILTRAKKACHDEQEQKLIRINSSHEELLQKLELISRPEEPPKKTGRLKECKNKSVIKEQASIQAEGKRKCGDSRPKGSKLNKPKNVDPTAGMS